MRKESILCRCCHLSSLCSSSSRTSGTSKNTTLLLRSDVSATWKEWQLSNRLFCVSTYMCVLKRLYKPGNFSMGIVKGYSVSPSFCHLIGFCPLTKHNPDYLLCWQHFVLHSTRFLVKDLEGLADASFCHSCHSYYVHPIQKKGETKGLETLGWFQLDALLVPSESGHHLFPHWATDSDPLLVMILVVLFSCSLLLLLPKWT